MSLVVWKFEPKDEPQPIPVMAQFLAAGWQRPPFGDGPAAWALVDPHGATSDRILAEFPTGGKLPETPTPWTYVGTTQAPDGTVWHLFVESL